MPGVRLCLMNLEIMTRQSLWEPVTRQSLVTRKMVIFASNDPLVKFWALLNGGMKWNEKPWFPVPFHPSIQQREILRYSPVQVDSVQE